MTSSSKRGEGRPGGVVGESSVRSTTSCFLRDPPLQEVLPGSGAECGRSRLGGVRGGTGRWRYTDGLNVLRGVEGEGRVCIGSCETGRVRSADGDLNDGYVSVISVKVRVGKGGGGGSLGSGLSELMDIRCAGAGGAGGVNVLWDDRSSAAMLLSIDLR